MCPDFKGTVFNRFPGSFPVTIVIPTIRTNAIWTSSRRGWRMVKSSNHLFITFFCCVNSSTIVFNLLFSWTDVDEVMVVCTAICSIFWLGSPAILSYDASLSTVVRIECMICGILCRYIFQTILYHPPLNSHLVFQYSTTAEFSVVQKVSSECGLFSSDSYRR